MSEPAVFPKYEQGVILECRVKRGDGTRERVRVIGPEPAGLRVEVLNPNPNKRDAPRERVLSYRAGVGRLPGAWGNFRPVETAEGEAIVYPAHGRIGDGV